MLGYRGGKILKQIRKSLQTGREGVFGWVRRKKQVWKCVTFVKGALAKMALSQKRGS